MKRYCSNSTILYLLFKIGRFGQKQPFFKYITRKGVFILALAVVFFLQPASYSMGNDYDMAKSKMSSEVFDLANPENTKEIAAGGGIEIREGRVLVVIELFEDVTGKKLQEKYDLKDAKLHKNLIEAWVLIEDLKAIAQEPAVKFVRRPLKFFKLI